MFVMSPSSFLCVFILHLFSLTGVIGHSLILHPPFWPRQYHAWMPVTLFSYQPLFGSLHGHTSRSLSTAVVSSRQRAVHRRIAYARDELFSVPPAALSPTVADQLSALNIHRSLRKRRGRRGGKRKQKISQIKVLYNHFPHIPLKTRDNLSTNR